MHLFTADDKTNHLQFSNFTIQVEDGLQYNDVSFIKCILSILYFILIYKKWKIANKLAKQNF